MRFDATASLYLLFLIPVIILGSVRSHGHGKRWQYLFARQEKRVAPHLVETGLLCAMAVALILSLAGPKIQYAETRFNRSGVDIAVGMDVSKSMLAEDVAFPRQHQPLFTAYNRLNRARAFVLSLVSRLRGERLGAFIFSSRGIEIIPFTRDYGYCNYILKHINAAEITIPGSDLASAIKTGVAMLNASPRAKALVLLSDGEDINEDPSRIREAATLAAQKGIRVYTVGIGGADPALIPLRSADGGAIRSYLLDEDGTYLKTRLARGSLEQIADLTGGAYWGVNEAAVPQNLITGVLRHVRGLAETRQVEPAWLDVSPYLLGAAFILAVMHILSNRYVYRIRREV